MNKILRIGIIAGVLVVVGAVMTLKQKNKDESRSGDPPQAQTNSESRPAQVRGGQDPTAKKAVPRLVDLGAGKCIPCKMMAPILESLKKEYAGRLQVDFIDVWQNPDAGRQYKIGLIPTQIFYDASGKELFRHEGFFSKEDILAKWKELGVDLLAKPAAAAFRSGWPIVAATGSIRAAEGDPQG
jgi:thioredoxin 1